MSSATPDYVLSTIWNNARGIGPGPAMTSKEWKALVKDMGPSFTFWGDWVDMSATSIGGGIYQIKGTIRG